MFVYYHMLQNLLPNFYGPFRNAIGSNISLKSDKKTYQMDYKIQMSHIGK